MPSFSQDPSKCTICGVPLTQARKIDVRSGDFNHVCEQHVQYREWRMAWLAQKNAGVSYEEPAHECEICFMPIDDENWSTQNGNDANIFIHTCTDHNQHQYEYNPDRVRFLNGYPNLKENTRFLRRLISATKKVIES